MHLNMRHQSGSMVEGRRNVASKNGERFPLPLCARQRIHNRLSHNKNHSAKSSKDFTFTTPSTTYTHNTHEEKKSDLIPKQNLILYKKKKSAKQKDKIALCHSCFPQGAPRGPSQTNSSLCYSLLLAAKCSASLKH